MVIRIDEGSFSEDKQRFFQRNSIGIPNLIWLLDGSTPVPNCRASEILLLLWALAQYDGNVITDVTLSGTAREYFPYWPISKELNDIVVLEWRSFWGDDLIRNGRRDAPFDYVPTAGLADLAESSRIASLRRDMVLQGLDIFSNHLHFKGTFEVHEITNDLSDISLGSIARSIPLGKMIGRFPCPVCTTLDSVSYHALRFLYDRYLVTNTRSERVINCKGAKAFSSQISDNTDLSFLTRATGFILNGMAIFSIFSMIRERLYPESACGMFIRHYSDPRGIFDMVSKIWNPFWITTRNYVRDAEGADISWPHFLGVLQSNPLLVEDIASRIMSSVPFVSDGRTVSIIV